MVAQPSPRELLLTIISEQTSPNSSASLQEFTVLSEARVRLGPRAGDALAQEAVLDEWNDLFRTGFLAWGEDLGNSRPPFFHVTRRGRSALAAIARDPSNPDGYLRHLNSIGALNPVADSYLREGLHCYVAGLHKAAAVMAGAALESLILELRDLAVARFTVLNKPVPSKLNSWKIKTVSDALAEVFHRINAASDRALRDSYDANWTVFLHQIRVGRNDAGHPTSVDPVTSDSVHASLLVFPELARLAATLRDWIQTRLS